MRRISVALLACVLVAGTREARSQARFSLAEDPGGMLQDALEGVLVRQPAVSAAQARATCVLLPAAAPNDRLSGPHGDSLISSRCEVLSLEKGQERFSTAQYRWISIFTAEDTSRGPGARDTVIEEEALVFLEQVDGLAPGWHGRFEADAYGTLRSMTPVVVAGQDSSALLSIQYCVNGTGGCVQEFLHRHRDGTWSPIRQPWMRQLPAGYADRILHGVAIDPVTLVAAAGFYGDDDANCCPSEVLKAQLALEGESLILRGQHLERSSP